MEGRIIATIEAGRLTMLRTLATTPDYRMELVIKTREPVAPSPSSSSGPFFSSKCAWTVADTDRRWRWGFAWEPAQTGGFPRSLAMPLWPAFFPVFIRSCAWWWNDIRMWRRRPGHCRRCGYDLRGLAEGSPCPECGSSKK
jgi:hypothetical protein